MSQLSMSMCRFLILTISILLVFLELQGRSFHNSVSNSFGGLYPHPGMRMAGRYKAIEGDFLIEENATMATAMTLDTMVVTNSSYRYQLRLANLNNKQGKTRTIKNPMTGDKTTLTSTKWGLVFNHDQQGNYYAVVLNCDNSTPYNDIMDQRTMHISLIRHNGEDVETMAETTLAKHVSLEEDMNTLCVDVGDHSVSVSIGRDRLEQVLEVALDRPMGEVMVGYLVGPGARVAVERAVLTIDNENQTIPDISWTREMLDEHFDATTDPIEGYWKYLDRDMEDKWLRLGGRYTLALVSNGDGYDIIYIDGAQVKKSHWLAGMKKGHLAKTSFTGNYDLTWIDATMEPIDNDDNYASIENGIILTLYFPIFKSQVRFAKVLLPE